MSDFELPPQEKPKASKSQEATSVKKSVDKVKEDDPEKDLPTPKFDPAELLQVFDTLIFEGSYSESVSIRKRLNVTFRTRTTEEMQRITQDIDNTSAVLMATVVERRNILNLYHALVNYQGKDLSKVSYEDRVKYINQLPAPVVGMMITGLYNFDLKVAEATKEGEENF